MSIGDLAVRLAASGPVGGDFRQEPGAASVSPTAMTRCCFALLAGLVLATPVRAAEVRPFQIQVDEAVLQDLRQRLGQSRLPDQIPGSGWEYGVDRAYFEAFIEHWRNRYDWRAEERRLNALPQFLATVDGLELHFVHVRSKHADALPLLLVHGWPGGFTEFAKLIPRLTDPEAHGGRADEAFHLVIPSLPGFGFSAKPAERGWSSQRMAETLAKLMRVLGYERYGAQGGDWGGGMVRWLASGDGARCVGAHSNFPGANRPSDGGDGGATPAELERWRRRNEELADHKAYGAIQGTRPLTLGYALNDSPAGLAAWVLDKFWAWSDHGGDLDRSFSKDELITNLMIYWVSQSMPSAMRIYYEFAHNPVRPATMTPFAGGGPSAPVGYALFPKEINLPPRAWVERSQGRLAHWTEMPRGGHFAAMEQPDLLAQDVRRFFAPLRPR